MYFRSLWMAASNATRAIWIAALLSVSGVSTLLGMVALVGFNQTPGAAGPASSRWPALSAIRPTSHADNLAVFVHPYCSCSVASIRELATLTPGHRNLQTTFFFYRPKGSGWQPGSLWHRVESELPGSRIVWDDDGSEASLFGARTSGYAVLYAARGEKLFSGGVTGSRGHEGSNAGIERLRASLESGRPADRASLVYGCALSSATTLSGGAL